MTLSQTTGDRTRYSIVVERGFTLRIKRFLGRYTNTSTGQTEYALCLSLGYAEGYICLPGNTKVEEN